MAPVNRGPTQGGPGDAGFRTTQWDLVFAAGSAAEPAAAAALDVLCATYWYPLYAYVRRRGFRAQEAEDLTQGFFAMLLEDKQTFGRADPARGRFRAYLLGALRNFLGDEVDKARAIKRGGGRRVVPLDVAAAEGRLEIDAGPDARPAEWHFDREWALTVLRRALDALGAECADEGKGELFEALRPHLLADGGETPRHAELAAALGVTEGGLKVSLSRLRRRYGEYIRQEIAQTLGRSVAVEDEVQHLFEVLRG